MDPLPLLADYGPIGLVASLAIWELRRVSNRYITRLEQDADRSRQVAERSTEATEAQTLALTRHEDRERARHGELMRAIRARRASGSVQQQ